MVIRTWYVISWANIWCIWQTEMYRACRRSEYTRQGGAMQRQVPVLLAGYDCSIQRQSPGKHEKTKKYICETNHSYHLITETSFFSQRGWEMLRLTFSKMVKFLDIFLNHFQFSPPFQVSSAFLSPKYLKISKCKYLNLSKNVKKAPFETAHIHRNNRDAITVRFQLVK